MEVACEKPAAGSNEKKFHTFSIIIDDGVIKASFSDDSSVEEPIMSYSTDALFWSEASNFIKVLDICDVTTTSDLS